MEAGLTGRWYPELGADVSELDRSETETRGGEGGAAQLELSEGAIY